jgi:hypothetical protein
MLYSILKKSKMGNLVTICFNDIKEAYDFIYENAENQKKIDKIYKIYKKSGMRIKNRLNLY